MGGKGPGQESRISPTDGEEIRRHGKRSLSTTKTPSSPAGTAATDTRRPQVARPPTRQRAGEAPPGQRQGGGGPGSGLPMVDGQLRPATALATATGPRPPHRRQAGQEATECRAEAALNTVHLRSLYCIHRGFIHHYYYYASFLAPSGPPPSPTPCASPPPRCPCARFLSRRPRGGPAGRPGPRWALAASCGCRSGGTPRRTGGGTPPAAGARRVPGPPGRCAAGTAAGTCPAPPPRAPCPPPRARPAPRPTPAGRAPPPPPTATSAAPSARRPPGCRAGASARTNPACG
eukprot:jgi/Mesvir1/21139/Mv25462-RA.1